MSKPSGELLLIDILQRLAGGARSDVVLGIGDDAAVTRVPADQDLVTATDALVEGTHFLAGADPRSIGHRSLACNLSDLAAMGATPRWASLSLALPAADLHWTEEFAHGFAALAARYDVALIGGDTVRGPLAVSVTVQGTVPAGTAVRRSGARAGDLLFVTGTPGSAAAGRLTLAGEFDAGSHAAALQSCFLFPEPRIAAGLALRDVATAMIDISDGMYTDITRLITASGCGARVHLPDLRDTDLGLAAGNARAEALWLGGGEDYELCFTAPPAQAADVVKRCGPLAVRQIGQITAERKLEWLRNGEPVTVSATGFEHFADGTDGTR